MDPAPPSRIDNTLVKAIVRAHRWRDMLESGDYATARDLAPKIVENILEGKQPASLELEGLRKKFPVEWYQQLEALTRIE